MARNCDLYFIQLNPLIFCDLLLTSVLVCGGTSIRTCEAGRWGTAILALGLSSVSYSCASLLPFPSHYFFSSQISQSTLREDTQMAFFVHQFPAVNWRAWISTKSGIRADFPPSPGSTRTRRRARRRGVASSYPRRIHFLRLY